MADAYSFVDVETTGSHALYGRVIEVGIVRVENKKIVQTLSTVINPDQQVDPFIFTLTGITQSELDSAPRFFDVLPRIQEILKDSIFVAHNVAFDYGFLKTEFRRYGYAFQTKRFDTIKLAKMLYPTWKNYNLDSIISHLSIQCERRHRAYDDAKVIADFFIASHKKFSKKIFSEAVDICLKRPSIPLQISREYLETLPEDPGVYIFYGSDKTPLYIGKSMNIRERVLSHFCDILSPIDIKIAAQLSNVETITTAGELGALFLESQLIKK